MHLQLLRASSPLEFQRRRRLLRPDIICRRKAGTRRQPQRPLCRRFEYRLLVQHRRRRLVYDGVTELGRIRYCSTRLCRHAFRPAMRKHYQCSGCQRPIGQSVHRRRALQQLLRPNAESPRLVALSARHRLLRLSGRSASGCRGCMQYFHWRRQHPGSIWLRSGSYTNLPGPRRWHYVYRCYCGPYLCGTNSKCAESKRRHASSTLQTSRHSRRGH